MKKEKFPTWNNNPTPNLATDPEFIKKFRAVIANTKFKPPMRGLRLLWYKIKWYCYHVPRNYYIGLSNKFKRDKNPLKSAKLFLKYIQANEGVESRELAKKLVKSCGGEFDDRLELIEATRGALK